MIIRSACALLSLLLFVSASGNAIAGSVDFVPYFQTGSSWWNATNGAAYRQSADDMLGQFEAVLRTSGAWDASIEVFFKEDGTGAFASTSSANFDSVSHNGSTYQAVGAWREIVQGAADDNGTSVDLNNGDGAETEIDWNFSLSTPDSNAGLLRHELMHSLGMTSFLGNEMPTMTGGVVTKRNVGGTTSAMVYDARILDLNQNPVVGSHVNGISYNVNDYAVDDDWSDANGSGLSFHGIADDGSDMYIALTSWNSGPTSDGGVQASHPREVSYAGSHPTWHTLEEVDRAFFRGMGYTLSTSTPNADFNQDGDVDGSDFLAWQKGESPIPQSAEELGLWESQYGSTAPSNAVAAVPTPEPSTLLLVSLAGLLVCSRSRRLLVTAT